MRCTIILCICTKSNTPCRHWIIVLEQMSTTAPRDGSSSFLEVTHRWCVCTRFRLYLSPSWSLLLGFSYTIPVTLFRLPSFWGAWEPLPFVWLNINLVCGTAHALVTRCGKGPCGFLLEEQPKARSACRATLSSHDLMESLISIWRLQKPGTLISSLVTHTCTIYPWFLIILLKLVVLGHFQDAWSAWTDDTLVECTGIHLQISGSWMKGIACLLLEFYLNTATLCLPELCWPWFHNFV